MVFVTVISLGFAPAIFWLWYFYKKDKLEPEPKKLVRNCFFWGMACVVPALLLETPIFGMSHFWGLVAAAPIVEELLKFFAVKLTVYNNNREFDEPMDGIVYAAAVALGFASLENCLYLAGNYSQGVAVFGMVTLIRALFSVPGHAFFSSIWGCALGYAKFADRKKGRRLIIEGLITSIMAHALFNFLCTLGPFWVVGMVIGAPFIWKLVHGKIKRALDVSPHHEVSETIQDQ